MVIKMTYTTKIFIKLSNKDEETISLRKDINMTVKPISGSLIRISYTIHMIKDVFYDGENNEFFVELENDSSPILKQLEAKYEQEGWVRSVTIKECKDILIERLCSNASILEMKIRGLIEITKNSFFPEIIVEFIKQSEIQSEDTLLLIFNRCRMSEKEISLVFNVLSDNKPAYITPL